MSEGDDAILAQMKEMGAAQVRTLMGANRWPSQHQRIALRWLADLDQESQRLSDALRAEDSAFAREANEIARAANSLAADANSIALAASASAERSAVAAITNNRIAKAALAAAIIAIVISVATMFIK